ncbi:MAG: hypothetical protein KC636_22865 [Myxococcales bacterium]|nr:hypothetical protein [Myxococcales bacterium]
MIFTFAVSLSLLAAAPASVDWGAEGPTSVQRFSGLRARADEPHILFVNFDGPTITEATWDNATKDETSLPGYGGPYEPFGEAPGGPVRQAVLDAVRADFETIYVEITDERPEAFEYTMIVVSPTHKAPGKLGFASVGCGGNPLGVGFAFYSIADATGIAEISATISHEAAHTLGLEHVADTADLMYPNQVNNSAVFVDACAPIDGEQYCADEHQAFCPPGQQNSYAELAALFGGPVDPNNTGPTVALVSPPDRSRFAVGEEITLVAEAQDDVSVSQVKLYEDDALSGTDLTAPYEWTRSYDEERLIEFHAVARDGTGNEVASEVILVAIGDAEFPPEEETTGTTGGGTGTGGDDSSGTGTGGGTGGTGVGGSDTGASDGADDEDGGCGCRARGDGDGRWLLVLLIPALGRRRRACVDDG